MRKGSTRLHRRCQTRRRLDQQSHIAANPKDWTRDPFVLIEENGNFYGRGTIDDKSQAAIFTDSMARLKAKKPPLRTTTLGLTWLNPHVYLDTVFLLGSIASTHGDGRWWFAAGAVVASVVWFFSLALGARFLGRWLSTPRAWRILDGVIAVVMIEIAISLVWPH